MLKSENQRVSAPAKGASWEDRIEVTSEGWNPACAPALRNLGLFQNSPQSTKVPSTQTSRAHHATCPRLLLLCINIHYWPALLMLFTTHRAASRPWWLSQQLFHLKFPFPLQPVSFSHGHSVPIFPVTKPCAKELDVQLTEGTCLRPLSWAPLAGSVGCWVPEALSSSNWIFKNPNPASLNSAFRNLTDITA